MPRIAIVQKGPVVNQLNQSIDKMEQILTEIQSQEVDLVVFGENWLCGYTAWMDYCPEAGFWDHKPVKDAWSEVFHSALNVKSEQMKRISSLVNQAKVHVVLGVNERIDKGPGNGSLFNTVLTMNDNGEVLNHHRKLMPTYTERLVHATGDGHGLRTVHTPFGQLGALICWEHWMPLTRQAMHDEGEDIHIALWPYVKEMHIIASRQYAFEGRCTVVSVGQMIQAKDTPKSLLLPDGMSPDKYVLNGGSCAINPDGSFLLEPQYGRDEVIYLDVPPKEKYTGEKMNLSISGHYHRPDIFKLKVNRKRYY